MGCRCELWAASEAGGTGNTHPPAWSVRSHDAKEHHAEVPELKFIVFRKQGGGAGNTVMLLRCSWPSESVSGTATPSHSLQVSLDVSCSLTPALQLRPAPQSLLGYRAAASLQEPQALPRRLPLPPVPKFKVSSLVPSLQSSRY